MSRAWLQDERSELAAERILDAVAELYLRRGVAGTGMGDVARAAGCSRATLYRYFENRRALQVAFVHREARRIGARIAAEVGTIEDPATRLLEGALAAVREVRADPTLAVWFALGDAGIAAQLAGSSEVINGLGATFIGDPADPEVSERARWLVRIIVSLLTVPGADEAEERAMLARFVVPVVTTSASSRSTSSSGSGRTTSQRSSRRVKR